MKMSPLSETKESVLAVTEIPVGVPIEHPQILLREKFSLLFDNINGHEIFTLAGALAYTTALALSPFILIILSLASFLSNDLQGRIYTQLSSSLGEKVGATIKAVIENADQHPNISGLSGLAGFVILGISASAIFSQLRMVLDKINEYEAPEKRSGVVSFIKERVLSVGLVLGFAFLSVVSMLVTVAIALLIPSSEGVMWQALSIVVNIGLFVFLFAAMYRFIPTAALPWTACFMSGVVSAVFYQFGKTLIGLYLATAGLETAYGAAGSLVVFLVWVYYTTLTLLISYEISRLWILKGQVRLGIQTIK